MADTYDSKKRIVESFLDAQKRGALEDPNFLSQLKRYIFQTFLFEAIYQELKKSPSNLDPLIKIWGEIPERLSSQKDSNWEETNKTFEPGLIKEKAFQSPDKRWDLMQKTLKHRRESSVRTELDHRLYIAMQKRELLTCDLDDFYIRYLYLVFTNTKDSF